MRHGGREKVKGRSEMNDKDVPLMPAPTARPVYQITLPLSCALLPVLAGSLGNARMDSAR